MAALSTAIFAASVVGAGAAVYAGGQNSKAIKNAGNVQKKSQDEAIAFQQKARDEAKAVLSKYSTEGDASRARQNAFLGLNTQKPTASGYAGALGGPGRAGLNPNAPNQYSPMGFVEGDAMAMGAPGGVGAPQAADPTQTPAETQEQAWAAFEASPWGKIGTMEAEQARDNFIASAGAQGSALSGRTARGMAEVSEEAKLRNFGGYYGALGEVTNRGYSADTGIASGGQQFANNATNITMQAGNNAADLAIAKGQNQANTTNDLASWIGWGMGNMGAGATGGSTSTYSGSAGSTAGRSRTGGFRSRIT